MMRKKNIDPVYGPLQIVHDFKFTALNVKDDYSVIDSLDYNGKLEHIRSRIDRLHRLGYGGVVMNVDYKNYLKEPTAFDLFFKSAEYAKSVGMQVWIYDEQYYPSGGAGGLTLDGHPELEAIGLACVAKSVKVDETVGAIRIPSPCGYSELKFAVAAPIVNGEVKHTERRDISDCRDLAGGLCFHASSEEWRVWSFFVRPLYELTKFCRGTLASRRYISVFNKKAVERFYKVTFEDGYCARSGGALSDVVDAVFTDEPYSPFYTKKLDLPSRTLFPSSSVYDEPNGDIVIYPYVPWEMTLPQRYEERHGHSISAVLPDIFDNTPKTKEARIVFYALLSDMSREAFPEQMAEKLRGEGIILSGHYYGEEGFDFQPAFYGDILDHLTVMGIPGCDCLWSDIDVLRYSTACKLASSAAHIAMCDDVMIEASNMVDKDQNMTLVKAKAAISAMFVHGINTITSYYGEKMLTENEMRGLTEHISSLSRIFEGGKYRVNTLLYYPFENLCAACEPQGIVEGHDRGEDRFRIGLTSAKLMKRQVCFDFINKKNLLSCEIRDGYLMTPYGEQIKYIVFPDIPWVDKDVADYICKARRSGVEIIFDGEKREIGDLPFAPSLLSEGVYPGTELSLKEEAPYITVMIRAFEGYDLFMLMNTDTEKHSVDIKVKNDGALALVDHLTGEKKAIKPVVLGDEAHFSVDIPALEAVIIGRFK